jgi:hypothetical protein
MQNKNEPLSGVWFECGELRFRECDSAVEAAVLEIKAAMAADWIESGTDHRLVDYGVHRRETVVPMAGVALSGWGKTSDPNGAISSLRDPSGRFHRIVRRVDYDCPYRGVYIAERWAQPHLLFWLGFDNRDPNDDPSALTREESHYCGLAAFISYYSINNSPQFGFREMVNRFWRNTTCDLDKNEVAEIALAARELGLISSYHDLLGLDPELLEWSEKLARIREASVAV